ncbi:MAG: serpin family protein [Phycisphaerales bacterium]|nr:MAG: serpin family protein [Phycisphaerales bacterium]
MKWGRRRSTCVVLFVGACTQLPWARPNLALATQEETDLAAVVEGNTVFALDLYDKLRTAEGNLFLSPYSISTALAMTYAGARSETAAQMADVLHFSLDQEELHPAFAALESSLEAASDASGCRLHVANALWGQQGHGFLTEFLALTQEHYGAGFREVDFGRATEQARQTINAWVADQTERKIKELLLQGDVDPSTVLALTNAIYFKGDWASQFDPGATIDAPFRISETEEVVVPMMRQTRKFALYEDDGLDVLELPYVGDRLSMLILLPKKTDGLTAVEESLSRENLRMWLGQSRVQPVQVSLPRFKLETRFDLSNTLQAMGMTDAFSGAAADFSGMTGQRDLFISLVIHEAQVEVNEEGTEAAAATAVVMRKGPLPAAFTADHPFCFLIRDKETGSILFLGRVTNPGE